MPKEHQGNSKGKKVDEDIHLSFFKAGLWQMAFFDCGE